MPYLLILSGPGEGEALPLEKARTVLGRYRSCDIFLEVPDPVRQKTISGRHAVIVCERGKYYLEDGDGSGKPSHNGTIVNDQPVPLSPARVLLHANDVIKICDFTFSFLEGPLPPPRVKEESSSSTNASINHASGSVFAQTSEKLRLLLEIGGRLSNTLDLDALLPQVVDSLLQHFKHADRAFLIEVEEASGALGTRVFKNRRPGQETRDGFSTSIVEECLEKKQGRLINDPTGEFPGASSIIGLCLRSVLCAPLVSQQGKAFGVLLLDSQSTRRSFTQEDLNFLMGVASQASIALANARFHRNALVRERYIRDLELAREVARSFLPSGMPAIADYEFYACNESAQEVGGDYYDFVQLKDGRLGILVGDVAGKGVAAALVMARFSAEVRACLRTCADLADAIRQLNELMHPLNLTDRFVTLAAMLLDQQAHTVTVVSAGHPSPLLMRRATGAVEDAMPRDTVGPPIGVLEDYPYEAHRVTLDPGDNLILFSDGVTEAMDVNERQLGTQGLRAAFQSNSVAPRKLGERLLQAVKKHAAGCSQHDDITLVCMGRLA